MKLALALASAVAALAVAGAASATALVENSGWQDDQINAAGTPSAGSSWDFTISDSAVFSIADCCIAGDTYQLFDGAMNLLATSTFVPGSASDVQASGSYGSYWIDGAYSRLAYLVGPGSYSFTIEGDGVGGVPAGFGVRLDSAVPEPGAWAIMLLGLGGLGATLRQRRQAGVAA